MSRISMSHVGGESSIFLITWKDAPVPDDEEQTQTSWASNLYPYFQGFLPVTFRTKIVWSVKVTHPVTHVEMMYYHHSPPLMFTGQASIASMRSLVGLMMREFVLAHEQVRASGLVIKSMQKVDFKVVLGPN